MDELLEYYNSELAYLRRLGQDFADRYPRIAGRLRLDGSGSDDPHVERLIEAFAFLTARIRKKLDDGFPEIAQSMLEVLYPQYLAPIPSISVVQFRLSDDAAQMVTGHKIPRLSRLQTEGADGEPCTYRTTSPVELWPVAVPVANLQPPPFSAPDTPWTYTAKSVLRLRLETFDPEIPFCDLDGLRGLTVYLHGQRQHSHVLYELLLNHTLGVALADGPRDPHPHQLGSGSIQPVGFDPDHQLFPPTPRMPQAYQLLLEYFAFPEKFLFVRFADWGPVLSNWQHAHCDVFVYLNRRAEELEHYVDADSFRTSCSPIVNLFNLTAEPIRITDKSAEWQVVPDARRPLAHEVYSIDRVDRVAASGEEQFVRPLFALDHGQSQTAESLFWRAVRRPGRYHPDWPEPGTDIFLSLLDPQLQHVAAEPSVLSLELTCLNRDFPSRLPFGGGQPVFQLESGGPVAHIDCLVPPTPTRRRHLRDGVVWPLVSHLWLNHLPLSGGPDGAETLRELLAVYQQMRPSDDSFPLDGILSVSSRRVVSRLAPDPGLHDLTDGQAMEAGFGRGIEVRMNVDEERFVGYGLFGFATVLERFFALQCTVNSFSVFVLSSRQRRDICRWPPRLGVR